MSLGGIPFGGFDADVRAGRFETAALRLLVGVALALREEEAPPGLPGEVLTLLEREIGRGGGPTSGTAGGVR